MTENQKNEIEEQIWSLLKGYEHIYTTVQPTLTYSTDRNGFCMQSKLLEKLPQDVRDELLKLLTIC